MSEPVDLIMKYGRLYHPKGHLIDPTNPRYEVGFRKNLANDGRPGFIPIVRVLW